MWVQEKKNVYTEPQLLQSNRLIKACRFLIYLKYSTLPLQTSDYVQ